MPKYIVGIQAAGVVDVLTLDEYDSKINSDESTDFAIGGKYQILHAVEAVNETTAVAIAVAESLNEAEVIDDLINQHVEDYQDENQERIENLDRWLSQWSQFGRKRLTGAVANAH